MSTDIWMNISQFSQTCIIWPFAQLDTYSFVRSFCINKCFDRLMRSKSCVFLFSHTVNFTGFIQHPVKFCTIYVAIF